jgi:hypothetical protein
MRPQHQGHYTFKRHNRAWLPPAAEHEKQAFKLASGSTSCWYPSRPIGPVSALSVCVSLTECGMQLHSLNHDNEAYQHSLHFMTMAPPKARVFPGNPLLSEKLGMAACCVHCCMVGGIPGTVQMRALTNLTLKSRTLAVLTPTKQSSPCWD